MPNLPQQWHTWAACSPFTNPWQHTGRKRGHRRLGTVTLGTNATNSSTGNWNAGSWTITPSAATGGTFSASNYSISYVTGTLTVNQLGLTISGVSGTNKGYDGGTSDTITGTASLNNVVSGDTVTLGTSGASDSFGGASVGTGKTVTFSGYTISGTDAGNYSLTQPSNSTANITTASLTITASGVTMTYADGTTLSGTTGFTSSGLEGSDTIGSVTLGTNATTSTSGNWNAGSWTITPSAATGGTFSASNYSISYVTGTLTVNQLGLTISGVSGTNKSYDGGTSDTITGLANLNGVVGSDAVTLVTSGASDSFGDPNVGTGKTVTFSGYTVSGTDAGNYSLTQPSNSTANITAASLTITASGVTMTYADGTTLHGTTGFSSTGLEGSDTIGSVTLGTNATNSSTGNWNAGSWTITPSAATGGTFSASNYPISYVTGTLTVNQAGLTISGVSGTNKGYDGGTSDTITGTASLNGVVSGDTVTLGASGASDSFGGANVGTGKTVTFSGYTISGTDGGNYSLTQPSNSTANITTASLTVTASAVTMTYADGTTLHGTTGFSSTGLEGSETIGSVTQGTNATFSTSGNWNAGSWTITPSAATGGTFSASNYSISYVTGTLTVNQEGLTISGVSGTNKAYDGGTSDTITGTASLNGVVNGDTVTLVTSGASASFGDKNVGTIKIVTFSGYTVSGTDAGNYSVSQPTSSANITTTTLTITASGVTMTYADGTTLSGTTGFSSTGMEGSDTIGSVTLGTNATISSSGNWNAGSSTITPSSATGGNLQRKQLLNFLCHRHTDGKPGGADDLRGFRHQQKLRWRDERRDHRHGQLERRRERRYGHARHQRRKRILRRQKRGHGQNGDVLRLHCQRHGRRQLFPHAAKQQYGKHHDGVADHYCGRCHDDLRRRDDAPRNDGLQQYRFGRQRHDRGGDPGHQCHNQLLRQLECGELDDHVVGSDGGNLHFKQLLNFICYRHADGEPVGADNFRGVRHQ